MRIIAPEQTPATLPAQRHRLQRRTLAVLIVTQIIGGIGVTIGIAVGALLAARIAGTAISGLGQSALVVGAALLAVPVTRIMAGAGPPARPGAGVPGRRRRRGAGGARRGRGSCRCSSSACSSSAAAPRPTSRPATPPWTSPSRPAGAGSSPWSSGRPRSARWPGRTSPRWPTGSVAGSGGCPHWPARSSFSAVAFVLAAGVAPRSLLRPDPLLTARRGSSPPTRRSPTRRRPPCGRGTGGAAARRRPPRRSVRAPAAPGCVRPGRWYATPPPGSASPRWRWVTW